MKNLINKVETLENISELTSQVAEGHEVYTKHEVVELLKALYVTIEESEEMTTKEGIAAEEVTKMLEEARQQVWNDARESAEEAFSQLAIKEAVTLSLNHENKIEIELDERGLVKAFRQSVNDYFQYAED